MSGQKNRLLYAGIIFKCEQYFKTFGTYYCLFYEQKVRFIIKKVLTGLKLNEATFAVCEPNHNSKQLLKNYNQQNQKKV